MTVENIFEYATRNKVRFPYKGNVSVEDLWDLPVSELDKVFKALNLRRKQSQEESLLNTRSQEDEIVETEIEIVKYIVSVKLAEKEARERASENRTRRQKIMAIMAARDDRALENASNEDLQKMLAELEG